MIKCYCARENGKEGFISFIVRKDSLGYSSRLQGWLNPLNAGDIALRRGLVENEGPGDRDPSVGPT